MPDAGATILHADLDAFYASVEQRDSPHLRGRPIAVGGGVVLAASYEAKALGVRTAMGLGEARRLCPGLTVVPPRMSSYAEASRAVFEVFHDTTPAVEGLSIDEAFLDVGGMREIAGTPPEIGARLRRRVRETVGLPISVGIARTKFLAKVASRVAKPDGMVEVPVDGEIAFLHPLPIDMIWGVGRVTGARLRHAGATTVAQVAALGEDALVALLGAAAGRHIHALACLRDPRPVTPGRRRRSIGSQRAIGRGRRTRAEVEAMLLGLVDRVTRRLRAAGRSARTVVLRLRFGDYTRVTRSHTLGTATTETAAVLDAERALLTAAWPLIRNRGLTLIGVTLAGLEDADTTQLALELDRARPERLDAALDSLHRRFGSGAVTRAALLGRDDGLTVPLLPD